MSVTTHSGGLHYAAAHDGALHVSSRQESAAAVLNDAFVRWALSLKSVGKRRPARVLSSRHEWVLSLSWRNFIRVHRHVRVPLYSVCVGGGVAVALYSVPWRVPLNDTVAQLGGFGFGRSLEWRVQ